MTIGNIETEEMVTWVSVLNVMECPSYDNKYHYDVNNDEARVENHTPSSEAPRRAPRMSFCCPVTAIIS